MTRNPTTQPNTNPQNERISLIIKIIGLVIAFLGLIATYLALPQIQAWLTKGSTVTIELPANAPWFDTSVDISTGQKLSITASGRVIMQADNETRFSPNGQDEFGKATPFCETFKASPCLVEGVPYVVLVARINNGAPFQVGSAFDAIVSNSGRLYLALNDNIDYYIDNSGNCEVNITIR